MNRFINASLIALLSKLVLAHVRKFEALFRI